MTLDFRKVTPVRNFDKEALDRLVVEINTQLDSTSLALGKVQDTSDRVSTVTDQTQGVVSGVIARVPSTYDPEYFAGVLTTILDRLNTVIAALQKRDIVGKKAD